MFLKQGYLDSLSEAQYANLLATTNHLGINPENGDSFLVPLIDRTVGTHIMGVPGSGKSALMESLTIQDIINRQGVILIDPHGDSVDHILARLPYELMMEKVNHIHLIDIADPRYSIGLNLLNVDTAEPLAFTQAVDRLMHALEVLWPDSSSQIYLPLTLRMAILALIANPGSTLVDLYHFLDDTNYRWLCLGNVRDQSVRQFWINFENLPKIEQVQQIMPLKNRLAQMVIGRPLVRNILGQKQTTINFRRAIENREVILIKLPLKTLPQDSRLIGTLLIAAIHEALFSFGNLPESQRPGVSLYVDEAQNFLTKDFYELLTEGRKFNCRLCVCHQFLGQLPPHQQQAVKMAQTTVCFRLVSDDALPMAPAFQTNQVSVRPEHIEKDPVNWLRDHETGNPYVQAFTDWYIRPLQHQTRYGMVAIDKPGMTVTSTVHTVLNVPRQEIERIELDPTHYLNKLLREVMLSGDPTLQIPSEIVYGFANCGHTFYSTFNSVFTLKGRLLRADLKYPSRLVDERNGVQDWVKPPKSRREQMYHFLFHLRQTMRWLALNPIGQKTITSEKEIARMLVSLPRRAAFVRSGDDIGVIYTEDSLPDCDEEFVEARTTQIKVQTIQKYCHEVTDGQPQNVADQDTEPLPTVKPQFKRYREV